MKKTYLLIILITSFILINFSFCSKDQTDISYESKIDSLLQEMTLEEKVGQMTQVDYLAFEDFNDIEKNLIGSVLWGGGSEVDDISAEGWSKVTNELQSIALKTRLKIPLIFGIDAVHGHSNVDGAVIFPHNVGLGCTRNPDLVEKAARVTAEEISGTGMHWTFAPCVAVARDERWGRTYESFSENPELVAELGAAAVRGFEGDDLADKDAVLSCTKHYLGDGGTTNGKDQGNTECNEESLRKIHLPGYIEAIKAGTGSIMVSYSSWNDEQMHGHKYLLTDVLKKELKFNGFLVSDWAAIDKLLGDFKSDIEHSINAGLDMIMVPNGPAVQGQVDDNGQSLNTYHDFLKYIEELVNEEKIPMERIDDAVKRILRVKFKLGLFDKLTTDKELLAKIGSQEHRVIARDCVRQSLVLLKNENKVLPLPKQTARIHFAGKGADNVGMQCGGWTIAWQGKSGDVISDGTTILEAAKNIVSDGTKITFSEDGNGAEGADFAIVVIGEEPYAEMFGDRAELSLSEDDLKVLTNVKKAGIPIVVILLSGRPMIIETALNMSDAFVAAWLPGTEGQGIADVLFGDYKFSGKLSHSWPRSMDQIPINVGDVSYDPLFPYGYGLTY